MAKAKLEVDGWAAATKRDLRNIQRETWRFVGKFWHRNYKAIKFTRRTRRYNFAVRSKRYNSYKRNKRENGQGVRSIGEVKPNVWSGDSRARAMARNRVNARAASSGRGKVDIIINAPTLNFKNPNSKAHPSREVTTVIESELQTMSKVGVLRFERGLVRLRRKKTIKR